MTTCLVLAAGCDDDGGSGLAWDAAGGTGGGGNDGSVRPDASNQRDASSPMDAPVVDAPVADASSGSDAAHDHHHDAAAPLPGVDAGVVACDYGSAASAATTANLNLFGQVVYLNGGQDLPAGRYVVELPLQDRTVQLANLASLYSIGDIIFKPLWGRMRL